MKETKKTSYPSEKAPADGAVNSGSPKDLPEKTAGDGLATDSGPHVNIKLSEEEVAEINEIFKGTAFFEDSPTKPASTKTTPLRGSAPVFVPSTANGKLQKWQTMKFISAGKLKTIKDTERSLPLPPPLPDETASRNGGEQEFNQRRESFKSVPPPPDLFAIPKPQQRSADSSKGRRQRRNSKPNHNKKGEINKKPEGGAVGGTSGFTDPFPLKFNPLTSRVMDMNAAEDFTRCNEKCGQCGHCAESFNYRMYVAD